MEALDATGLPLAQFCQVPEPQAPFIHHPAWSLGRTTDDGRRTTDPMARQPTLRPRRVQRELASMGTHHVSLCRHPPAPAACSLPPCRRRPSSYLDRFIVHSAIAPPCNNGPAPRPPRLDLSSSNMASRDESGEPGASLSLPGSAGPISPMAPIRSLGSATDTRHPLRSVVPIWVAAIALPAAPVRVPDDGVLSRSLATRAVQRPLPGDGRRLCSAARAPSPTHSSAAHPPRPPGPDNPRRLREEAEMCLLACGGYPRTHNDIRGAPTWRARVWCLLLPAGKGGWPPAGCFLRSWQWARP